METTSTMLTWAMLYMARYPSVQRKVQEELDRVVGTHRRPALEDRGDLPYTEATIMEIQRYANMTPLGLPHYCRSDITVGNMTIPAGSRVWGLFAEIHKVCLYHMETRKKIFFLFKNLPKREIQKWQFVTLLEARFILNNFF